MGHCYSKREFNTYKLLILYQTSVNTSQSTYFKVNFQSYSPVSENIYESTTTTIQQVTIAGFANFNFHYYLQRAPNHLGMTAWVIIDHKNEVAGGYRRLSVHGGSEAWCIGTWVPMTLRTRDLDIPPLDMRPGYPPPNIRSGYPPGHEIWVSPSLSRHNTWVPPSGHETWVLPASDI